MRARIKSFDEMPPHVKCCEANNEAMKPYCGTEVELNPELRMVYSICPHCGNRYEHKGFRYIHEPHYSIGQDMIDIDEGETPL